MREIRECCCDKCNKIFKIFFPTNLVYCIDCWTKIDPKYSQLRLSYISKVYMVDIETLREKVIKNLVANEL